MKKNIVIFLSFLIFTVFYVYHDSSNFASAFNNPLLCDSYEEIGCPWGNDYNDDVGIRTAEVYCLDCDSNFMCTTTGDWTLYEDCNDCQYCNEENSEYSCTEEESSPLYPKDGQEDVLRPVTLDWCSIDDADSYKIKIWKWEKNETDDGSVWWSGSLLGDLESKQSTVCAKSLEDKEDVYYRWQIAPCYGTSCDSFSPMWDFDTGGKQAELELPSLTFPANGEEIDIPVTLRWDEVSGAKSYYVEVIKAEDIFKEEREAVVFGYPTSNNLTLDVTDLNNEISYVWNVSACLGEDGNACGPNCCFNEGGDECSGFYSDSPRIFKTTNEVIFNRAKPISPANKAPSVRPSDLFEWESLGATGFLFQIIKDGNEVLKINTQNTTTTLSSFNQATTNALAFNTEYIWQATPCWWGVIGLDGMNPIFGGTYCDGNKSSSQSFTTSGGIIESLLSPTEAIKSPIPVVFSWEEVPNAFSYSFQLREQSEKGNIIAGTELITRRNAVSLDYPFVEPLHTYFWEVMACAEEDGSYCEDTWHGEGFTVEEFPNPSSKQLEDGKVFTYENNLIWEHVASTKNYKYTIQYNGRIEEVSNEENEEDENCIAGTLIKEDAIISSNYILMPIFPGTQQKCLGEYTLWVTACLTKDCEGMNDENSSKSRWTFNYIQSSSSEEGGIMPCNRSYDFENTPWNEREICQLKHVPILIYNIIDFILWRASLIALLVLIVFSGIIAYASAGLPVKVVSIKEVWKNAGRGYLVMFFAWTIISLVLRLLGITESFLMLPSFL